LEAKGIAVFRNSLPISMLSSKSLFKLAYRRQIKEERLGSARKQLILEAGRPINSSRETIYRNRLSVVLGLDSKNSL
jgi:hypothetical protein